MLALPVIIIGGIVGGTPSPATEGGAIAVVLALLIGFFYTRELTIADVLASMLNAGLTTRRRGRHHRLLLIGDIHLLNRPPARCAQRASAVSDQPIQSVFLLLIFFILVLVGMFMESTAAYVMLVPIFAPMAVAPMASTLCISASSSSLH